MGGGSLVFAVNGERFEISKVDHPSTTLLQFLRSQTPFQSVKLSCGEGGCGACVVLLSKYDPVHHKVENYTINSCLTLVCSIHGCSITTTEGLGSQKTGFHPIHQRLAGFHAAQCGYCTPGISVSLFSALLDSDKSNGVGSSSNISNLTVCEAEKAINGNLCRCTGYRPIADACKSFAADVDIEDLGLNTFWKNEEGKEVKLSRLPIYDPSDQISVFPDFLKNEIRLNMLLDSGKYSWHTPLSIEELEAKLNLSESKNLGRVKLVASNTGTGYYKELDEYDTYIDLRCIPELSTVKKDAKGIQIGAAVSISKAIIALKEDAKDGLGEKISAHFEKIASLSVRNSASIGGNIVMSQRCGFPSDIVTVLLAVDCSVEIIRSLKRESIKLEEFLIRPPLDPKSVIVSVNIPIWVPSSISGSKLVFETNRASPRPLGNVLPYLNAACLAEVFRSDSGFVVSKIRLAFGAYGSRHPVRAKEIEEFLAGRNIDREVICKTMSLVRAIVVPKDEISHGSYRTSLAEAFVFEFLHALVEPETDHLGFSSLELNGYKTKEGSELPLLLPSKQVIQPSTETHPVGEPIGKTAAALLASGEAIFVDDIPSPKDCLYGAFVYSTKPFARVKCVRYESDSFPEGVVSVISYKDIPDGGENIGAKLRTKSDKNMLFADEFTRFAGERIALVVADTQKRADIAATKAVVDYDVENLEPPILTVEEALDRKSFFDSLISPKPVGDFAKGMDEAEQKILSAEIRLPSQHFFYMETQTALAIPDEDNCMVVYLSSQDPESAHSVIASCLGLPQNNIRVITRRVGGGFGGKAGKAVPIATACALAAHKLGRPVRMYLDRKTDMITVGGRHPMKITYSVGFKLNGKITALHLDILIDAGISEEFSPLMPYCIVNGLEKYDWGALSFDIKLCKTNHTSKTAMRAPGRLQGSFIAEAVIEHVASTLFMDVDVVREKNFHTFDTLTLFYDDSAGEHGEYTLPSIWDKLALSSNFHQRKETIKQFNSTRKWSKRGISRIPIIYGVNMRPTPGKVSILSDGSIAVEVGGIELGQGLWTKVKQMAAFALSSINCAGSDRLLDKVRVIQADTLSMVQGGLTAGSTTSESSCEAVRICCNTLVERLIPVLKRLEEQMGSISWETLISKVRSANLFC
ncbi:unnamed protein product [Amaranthus hypochondriacus]